MIVVLEIGVCCYFDFYCYCCGYWGYIGGVVNVVGVEIFFCYVCVFCLVLGLVLLIVWWNVKGEYVVGNMDFDCFGWWYCDWYFCCCVWFYLGDCGYCGDIVDWFGLVLWVLDGDCVVDCCVFGYWYWCYC